MVPLLLSTEGLKIIVFGGGKVALRKCRYFEGSEITVVAERIDPEIERYAEKTIIMKVPEDADIKTMIDSFEIVIAATDNRALNDRIRNDAIYMGIYVNSAHGGGSILIPSILKREKYLVAVSSEGRVPAFPPYVVEKIDSFLDDRYDRTLDLLIELRAISKERISEQRDRRDFIESVLKDSEIEDLIADNRMDEAKATALRLGGLD